MEFTLDSEVEFHALCDASEKAYAATNYIHLKQGDRILIHLLYAKSKVAPVKTVSLPRLELSDVSLLADMI